MILFLRSGSACAPRAKRLAVKSPSPLGAEGRSCSLRQRALLKEPSLGSQPSPGEVRAQVVLPSSLLCQRCQGAGSAAAAAANRDRVASTASFVFILSSPVKSDERTWSADLESGLLANLSSWRRPQIGQIARTPEFQGGNNPHSSREGRSSSHEYLRNRLRFRRSVDSECTPPGILEGIRSDTRSDTICAAGSMHANEVVNLSKGEDK